VSCVAKLAAVIVRVGGRSSIPQHINGAMPASLVAARNNVASLPPGEQLLFLKLGYPAGAAESRLCSNRGRIGPST